MTTSPFNDQDDDAPDLDEALEEFVWEYRNSVVSIVRSFLDDRLDYGPKRFALEEATRTIFEDSSTKIAAVLKKGLRS